jgi:hypothetical protein
MLFSHRQINYLANPQGRTAQTAGGTASVSATQFKFGSKSLDVPNSSNARLTTTGHTDSSFTLEGWVRSANWSTSYRSFFGGWNSGQTSFGLGAYSNFIITLQNSTGSNVDFDVDGTLATNTWHHIALTRSGTTAKLFVNGTQRGGDKTLSGTMFGSGHSLILGQSGIGQNINGFCDEVRLSKGIRYTGSFTPSTSAFVNDSNTVLLCHCEVAPLVDDAA